MSFRPARVLENARIWTGCSLAPDARAMAVRGDRLLAVGDERDVRSVAGAGAEVVDLEGAFVMPGFHDAHLHLAEGAVELAGLDLRNVTSAEEAAARVQAKARALSPGSWVRGWGWDQTRWPSQAWPDRFVLDRVVPDHPVFLARVDGHVAWINTAALCRLGLEPDTPRATNGILLEREMEEARGRLPQLSEACRRSAVSEALRESSRLGITAVQDICPAWALTDYAALREEGRLTARVSAWLPLSLDRGLAEGLRGRFPSDDLWIAVGTLKVFLDGTLGARTAALRDPYADDPTRSGDLRVDGETLAHEVRRADEAGWAVAMHAVGDRAVRLALDTFELLPKRARRMRHRIEHAQVVLPEDVLRFASLGVTVSLQPAHLVQDRPWIEARLGGSRRSLVYPLASFLGAGVSVAFGTDWPVASLDPREGLMAAVGRRDASPRDDPLCPEEAATWEAALGAYTSGSARAAGRGETLGLLRPGMLADFVVLSDDPRAPPESSTRPPWSVLRTCVGGRWVYPEVEPLA